MFLITIPIILILCWWVWGIMDCSDFINAPDIVYIRREKEKKSKAQKKRELKKGESNIWI